MALRLSTGMVNARAQGVADDFAGGILAIFGNGTQPASANDAETGTLLCLVTVNGAAHEAGVGTNGLHFTVPTEGVIDKDPAETWTGTILEAAGTGMVATHFRMYDKNYVTGISSTAKRFDGSISTSSSSQLYWSNTTLVAGAPFTVNTFPYTVPKA